MLSRRLDKFHVVADNAMSLDPSDVGQHAQRDSLSRTHTAAMAMHKHSVSDLDDDLALFDFIGNTGRSKVVKEEQKGGTVKNRYTAMCQRPDFGATIRAKSIVIETESVSEIGGREDERGGADR